MIDINELRMQVHDFKRVGSPMFLLQTTQMGEILDRLEAAEKELAELRSSMKFRTSLIGRTEAERDALRAKIEEMERQEPTGEWWNCLIADISAVDCAYPGSPTYAHDAYWMRDRVVQILEKRRDSLPGAQNVPKEAIAKILTEVMDIATSNGADSRSMPDEYVEVAAWLCGIPTHPHPAHRKTISV